MTTKRQREKRCRWMRRMDTIAAVIKERGWVTAHVIQVSGPVATIEAFIGNQRVDLADISDGAMIIDESRPTFADVAAEPPTLFFRRKRVTVDALKKVYPRKGGT